MLAGNLLTLQFPDKLHGSNMHGPGRCWAHSSDLQLFLQNLNDVQVEEEGETGAHCWNHSGSSKTTLLTLEIQKYFNWLDHTDILMPWLQIMPSKNAQNDGYFLYLAFLIYPTMWIVITNQVFGFYPCFFAHMMPTWYLLTIFTERFERKLGEVFTNLNCLDLKPPSTILWWPPELL